MKHVDPEWIQYRFVALLKCNNKHCQDCVTVTGRGEVKEVFYSNYGHYEQEYLDIFILNILAQHHKYSLIPENTLKTLKKKYPFI
ncbi:MAG: hypothetical protein KF770_21835 [Anaerolineae bacterium]|nr:hypothetical protein [Anaerolineae bacterium]